MNNLLITISGPCGSGKSILAQYIAAMLQNYRVNVDLQDEGNNVTVTGILKPEWLPETVSITTEQLYQHTEPSK